MKTTKKQFILTIEVDNEQIVKKYPNYKFNFSSPDEFIKWTIEGMKYAGNTNMSKDGIKEWGYSIKIKKLMLKD